MTISVIVVVDSSMPADERCSLEKRLRETLGIPKLCVVSNVRHVTVISTGPKQVNTGE